MTTGMWCVVISRLEPATHLKAIHVGHHHVEQHDIAFRALACRKCLLAVRRGNDVKVLRRKPRLEQFDVGGYVIHDKNTSGHQRTSSDELRKCRMVSMNLPTEMGLDR